MVPVLTEIVQILVGGLSTMASGIATGLKDMTTALFLETSGETTQLSTFGGVVAIFAGISLAVGLTPPKQSGKLII